MRDEAAILKLERLRRAGVVNQWLRELTRAAHERRLTEVEYRLLNNNYRECFPQRRAGICAE